MAYVVDVVVVVVFIIIHSCPYPQCEHSVNEPDLRVVPKVHLDLLVELEAEAERLARRRRQRASVGKISAKCCSFSAVSAPIFARKYAFCSIFQIYQII